MGIPTDGSFVSSFNRITAAIRDRTDPEIAALKREPTTK